MNSAFFIHYHFIGYYKIIVYDGTNFAKYFIVCVFMGIAEGTKNGELCFFYF